MAHAMKRQFAVWSPQYFRPRDGAEQMHVLYLEYLIGSADHETAVLDDDGVVVGFYAIVPQSRHLWVDDLYLVDGVQWPVAVDVVRAAVSDPWVTCVSRFDDERAGALRGGGLDVASSYWGRSLDGVVARPAVPRSALPDGASLGAIPSHTFGGAAFDPGTEGALVVVDDSGGVLVGSPGVRPPLYDPGGPACVVDRIGGTRRHDLLAAGMAAASDRGDAAMVVVCATGDVELSEILAAHGFRAEVDLFAT